MKVITFHLIRMRTFPKGRQTGSWEGRSFGMQAFRALRLGEPDTNGAARSCRPQRDRVTCRFGWGKVDGWNRNKATSTTTPHSPTPAVPLEVDLAEFTLPSKGEFNSNG